MGSAEGIRSIEQLQRVFPDLLNAKRATKALLSIPEAERIKTLFKRPDIPYLNAILAVELV